MNDKILVVDDNPMNRELIISVLDQKGLFYDQASGGKEALQLTMENNYQMVFIDLLMPGINGFEAIRRMRKKGMTLPIVAVSAISSRQDRQAAFEAGANDFIPKPVDIELLMETIDKYRKRFQGNAITQNSLWLERPEPGKGSGDSVDLEVDLSEISIILVEEDTTQREHFAAYLQNSGCQVNAFENGADAWRSISDSDDKPDIVISNIRMPEIDGLGLLAMTKREYSSILFFLYAPQFDADTIQLAAQEGVDCIFAVDTFIETIIELIASEFSKSKNSPTIIKSALLQVKKAHEQMIQSGCDSACSFCDISHASLLEAGGDVASCRKFNLEERCGMILMDVAGHDFVSSYLSAVFWGILSSHWDACQKPAEIATLLNDKLYKLGNHNSHICLTAALWDPHRRKLAVTWAGNPGGIQLSRKDNDEIVITELQGGGMVLGLLPENKAMVHREFEIRDECSFFFFSDGVEKDDLLQVIEESGITKTGRLSDISSRQLMEQLLSRQGQQDDMIIVKLNLPPMPNKNSNHLAINSSFESVDYACKWLEANLSRGVIPKGQEEFDIMLCVREALLNAVEHGNQSKIDKLVDLTVLPQAEKLEIRVSDEGPGFGLKEKLDQAQIFDESQIGKRGLPMIKSFADSVEVTGGSIVMAFYEKSKQNREN